MATSATYVGLLAGPNDMELLAATRVGRDVNRHRYTAADVDEAVRRPVVRALFRLIRFRNAHPAFDGEFAATGGEKRITLTWTAGADLARLSADLATGEAEVTWSTVGGRVTAPLADLP